MSARLRLTIFCGLVLTALIILASFPPAPANAPVASESMPINQIESSDGIVAAPAPRVVFDKPAGAVRAFGDPRFRAVAMRYFSKECFAFSPDGTRVAATTDDWTGEVTVWEYPSGRTVCRFAYGGNGIFDVLRFTTDNSAIVGIGHSGSDLKADWCVESRRYNAATGKLLTRAVLTELDASKSFWAAISPDGTTVLARNEYGPLRMFSVAGGVKWRLPLVETEHELTVTASGDGSRFAATILVGDDIQLRTYDAATGRETGRVDLTGRDFAPVCSGDGTTIATVNRAETAISLWHAQPLNLKTEIKLARPAYPLTFSPNGKWLATQARGGGVDVYNTATGTFVYRLHSSDRNVVAFTPDSRAIALPAGGLGLYDAATGKPLPHSADPPNLDCYNFVYFSPDGRTLTAHTHNRIKLATWDVATGHELERHEGWGGREACYSPGGRFRLDQIPGQPVGVVDQLTGRTVRSFVWPTSQPIYSWQLSGDGRIIFSGDEYVVNRSDTSTGKLIGPLADFTEIGPLRTNVGEHYPSPVVCASPCGRYTLVYPRKWATGRIPVQAFDCAAGKLLARWDATFAPGIVGWSSDGGRVATGLFADTGEAFRFISPNILGTNEERHAINGIAIRELPSGKLLRQVRIANRVGMVCVSPDLRTFVASAPAENGDRTIYLYETATGHMRHTIDPGERWNGDGTFSPDGRYLATLHPKSLAVLWDIRTHGSHVTLPPDASGWANAWEALGVDDAKAAFAALRLFAAFPDRGVEVLRERVAAFVSRVPLTAAQIAALIDRLGSDDFRTRETATSELTARGRGVETALRAAAKSSPLPEVRNRSAAILTAIRKSPPDHLHLLRAVEAAEWMGTPEATQLLKIWAAGPIGSFASEATSSLARLKSRRQEYPLPP